MTTVVTTSAVRQRLRKRCTQTQAQLSPTRTQRVEVPAPYGVQRSIASHAPLVRTAPKATANTALYRCPRPPTGTGITVSNTATKQMLLACRRPAKRMLPRFGPMLPRRHRCDCRAIRPTAGVAAPSESLHRDALAVETRKRAESAIVRLERSGPRSGDGLEFGIFAQSVLTR